MLKAIFFDLDDTLIDRRQAWRSLLEKEVKDQADREYLDYLDDHGHGCRERLFDAWRARTGQSLDQKNFVKKLRNHLGPNLKVQETLTHLSKFFRLGLISNGGAKSQWSKLNAAKLLHFFPSDHVFLSGCLQIAKPDPRLFLLAATRFGLAPQQCLFVGDRDDIDRIGAEEAGFTFVKGWLL